jgi:hypothetical protein
VLSPVSPVFVACSGIWFALRVLLFPARFDVKHCINVGLVLVVDEVFAVDDEDMDHVVSSLHLRDFWFWFSCIILTAFL